MLGMWWLNGSAPDCKIYSSRFESGISPACRDMSVPCWEASRVGMVTAGWPLRGGRGKKYKKAKKIIK